MADVEEPKDKPEGDREERRSGGRFMFWRVLLGMIILIIVFAAGVEVGKFQAYFGGPGYGYWGPMRMHWWGNWPGMMAPGWWYYGSPGATSTATSTIPAR